MITSLRQITGTILPSLLLLLNKGGCIQFSLLDSVPQRILIPSNETSAIYVQDVPPSILFAVIQLHAQWHNLYVSSGPSFFRNSTKSGPNVGMVTFVMQSKKQLFWYLKTDSIHNVTAVAYVQLYTQYDPVPGGCNQVFSLPVDPSVVLNVGSSSTNIWFQWSNLAVPKGQPLPDCENATVANTLKYDVYVSFVQQRDFSEETYFEKIESMLNPDSIIANSVSVFSVQDNPNSKSEVIVTSETNQGVLYAVVVTRLDSGRQAAYVTASSYACSFEKDTCSSRSTALEIVFAVFLCWCGLFLLVLGHSYFKITMFVFGFTFPSLLSYILLSLDHALEDQSKIPVSMAFGVVGGSMWVAFWYFCAFPIMSVLIPGICAGYLISSVVFFTPFGNIWWFDTSLNYAVAFVCVVLLFSVMLMAYQKLLSIVSCSIIGAYMFLMCIAIPLKSSLRLIFLNALHHQTLEGYVAVKVVAPFQAQDIALSILWPLLVVAGTTLQFYRGRQQPPFQIPERHRRMMPTREQVPHLFSAPEEENITYNTDDERSSLLPREAGRSSGLPRSYQTIPYSDTIQINREET